MGTFSSVAQTDASRRRHCPTSQLDLLNAHVHHHGPCGVVGFDQGGEVTAEHLLDPAQVRLAVTGNQFGALFVYVQAAV